MDTTNDNEVLMLDLDDIFGKNASVKMVDTETGDIISPNSEPDVVRKDNTND